MGGAKNAKKNAPKDLKISQSEEDGKFTRVQKAGLKGVQKLINFV